MLESSQPKPDPEVDAIDPIRVELLSTELPVHQVAKRGEEEIRILKRQRGGQVEARWSVDYNAKVGHPGQLAYRLDTWVIKRRLSALRRPFPRLVRIGDLREIARELNHGGDTNAVRRAFEQNATTFIRAKLAYRTTDGLVETLEGYFNRYTVFYRGHALPGGRRAETVYISLNDPYYGMVSSATVRPLDFAYMRRLSPAAQRFYELLSPRLFAAIRYGHESAWIRYSDYCQHAVQKRQGARRRMQTQMAHVQRPHLRSSYIEAVEYENAPADDGGPDWILRYRPGPRAREEYRRFNEERPGRLMTVRQAVRPVQPSEPMQRIVPGEVVGARTENRSAAESLASRFMARRHGGAQEAKPTEKQIRWAESILDALGNDVEAANTAVDLAGDEGRDDPKGFPSHLSGVIEGGYVARAIELRDEKRAAYLRRATASAEGERRARFEIWCDERAVGRVAQLDADTRPRIVDERLPELLHRYRYFLRAKSWPPEEVRVWAEPRILAEYGREGQPTYEDWCRQAQPPTLQ
jgi:hypothetical protein